MKEDFGNLCYKTLAWGYNADTGVPVMRYQLSWHRNQSLDPSPAKTSKGSARAKWEDRFSLSWHVNHPLDVPFKDERQEPAQTHRQGKFSNFWHVAMARLMMPSEPQVWQSVNAAGQITWNAYDANSEKAVYGVSETELRSWLENLHYQN